MSAAREALARAFEGLVHNQDDGTDSADRALSVLLGLPVEDRMEAIGLRCSPIVRVDEVVGYVGHTPEQAERWQAEWAEMQAEWDDPDA